MHLCYIRYMFPPINCKGSRSKSSEISVYIAVVLPWLDDSYYFCLVFPKGRCRSALFILFIQESQLLYVVATTAYVSKIWMPWVFSKHAEKLRLVLVHSGRHGLLHQTRSCHLLIMPYFLLHLSLRVSLWSSYCFCSAVRDGPTLHGLNQHYRELGWRTIKMSKRNIWGENR